ncbi:MAG: hypothetical protein NTV51_08675, partial [Verrucomicrobia bacterium]|nr:hypothetical protein [Verrucomicrobiota bacterium]
SGIGMLHTLHLGFPGWAIVKLVCWLGLASITGLAYKRRAQSTLFMQIALGLAIVAVFMVELKPF